MYQRDTVRSMAKLIGTTPVHADAVFSTLSYSPGIFTVNELVQGRNHECGARFGATGLTASEVRRALGYLYGCGRAKIVSVVDGVESWALTSNEEKSQL